MRFTSMTSISRAPLCSHNPVSLAIYNCGPANGCELPFYSQPLVEHVYRSRPPSAATLRPLYFTHPVPRPSLLYFPSTSPPVTVFSVVQSNLLFLAVSEVDTEPLLALEFLHRAVDVLEEFVGAPLISTKIQSNYDVVAQLLHEMCDAGLVCNTELNALQEVVDMPGWMGKLLGGVGLVFKLRDIGSCALMGGHFGATGHRLLRRHWGVLIP